MTVKECERSLNYIFVILKSINKTTEPFTKLIMSMDLEDSVGQNFRHPPKLLSILSDFALTYSTKLSSNNFRQPSEFSLIVCNEFLSVLIPGLVKDTLV